MALAKKSDTIINRLVGAGGEIVYEGVRVQAFLNDIEQQLYSDNAGTPVNLVQTDTNGLYSFWIEEGTYNLRFSVGGVYIGDDDYLIINPVSTTQMGGLVDQAEAAAELSGERADIALAAAAEAQAAATDALDAGGQVRKATWAELAAVTTEPTGRIGVSLATTGTHASLSGDVGASGGQTPNGGQFRYASGTGWVRIGALESEASKAWAQSPTAPDPSDPTSKSAKAWATQAQTDGAAQVALAAGYASSAGATVASTNTRMTRLSAQLNALRTSQPTPYVLHPVTERYRAALVAAGVTPTEGRLNRHSRLMDRLDAAGIRYDAGGWGAWVVGETEAGFLINILDPGALTLTKAGSPVFTANRAVHANGSVSNYYEIPITLGELTQTDFSMGFWSNIRATDNVVATGFSYEMGAFDGSNGVAIQVANTTTTFSQFRCFGPLYSPTANFNGRHCTAINRSSSTGFKTYHLGVPINTVTQASVATVNTGNRLRLLTANGATFANSTPVTMAFIGKSMTDAQMAEFCAAMEDFMRCVLFGDPFVYPKGVGPVVVDSDVVVYGLTPAAFSAAYEAKRRGYNVAMVGDWFDETTWDFMGMPASGLWWTDTFDSTAWGGSGREAIHWARAAVYGNADADTQSGVSVEPRAWVYAARRMLDPARTDTSASSITFALPGRDIKVYMTGGVNKVSTRIGGNGPEITSISTRDGRTFKGKMFFDGSYDQDLIPLAGLPSIVGMEPAGSGVEAFNGFHSTLEKPGVRGSIGGSNFSLDVDPYRTPGVATSGLLPILEKVPAITANAPDTQGLQAMNLRLTASSSTNRMAFWDATPPPGYSAERYEALARRMAAATAAGKTFAWSGDLFADQTPSGGSAIAAIYDLNDAGAFTTDLMSSGIAYAAAGMDPVARRGVFDDVLNYERGLIYWLLYSNDSRIPAAVKTTMQARWLDPLNHIDPGFGRPLFWPRQAYRRDATYNLVNADFVLTGNDLVMTDGSTPRSIKTIATACYFLDVHTKRGVVSGGLAYTQGHISVPQSVGANQRAPLPMECITPQPSLCTNLVVSFGGSWTKVAHSCIRMEPTMTQIGDAAAAIMDYAIRNGVAVRDADYSTVRADLLSLPYTKALTLPQVN